ncbi:MAG TPA: UrcA family protein [Woeseiaceae bacterium]|nr:UrcA family protein [Woeseiaceae bacterium]
MKNFRLALFSMITFGLSTATPALGASPGRTETFKISVSLADLDLERDRDVATLYTRLRHAAESACDVRTARVSGSLKLIADTKLCYQQTLYKLVSKIDNDSLTQVYVARNKARIAPDSLLQATNKDLDDRFGRIVVQTKRSTL